MKKIFRILSVFIALALIFPLSSSFTFAESTDEELEMTPFGYSSDGYTTYTIDDVEMLWPLATKTAPGTSVSCTGVQGLNVGKNYIYSVKTDSDDRYAVFDRINANTGAAVVMNYYSSKNASSPSACNTVWHANDLFVGTANDVSALYVATTEKEQGITRMEISGENLYFTGFFRLVDPSGQAVAAGGMACVSHKNGYFYMLIKQGKTNFYFTKIPDAATGGTSSNPTDIPCFKIFTIDMKNLIVAKSNSTYGTLGNEEVWVTQGFGYNSAEKAIYVPMYNGMENTKENIIICFDVKDYVNVSYLDSLTADQSPMLFPSRTSFHIIDTASTKFEIENCGFRTSQGEDGDLYLYFNTNSNVASREGVGRIKYKSGTAVHDSIVDENSIVYTVAYNGNGGAMPDDVSGYYRMTATTHIKGIKNNLRPNSFERSGYTFAGWYLNRRSDGKWLYYYQGNARWYTKGEQPAGAYLALYADRKAVSALTSEKNDKITCYAQWTPVTTGTQTYYLQYDANGGAGTMQDQAAIYGQDTYIRTNTFVRQGYVFLGWNAHRRSDNAFIYIDATSADLPSSWLKYDEVESKHILKTYTDGCSVKKTGAVDMDIVTLYAVWGKATVNAPQEIVCGENAAFTGSVSACSPSLYKAKAEIKNASGQTVMTNEANVSGASLDMSAVFTPMNTSALAAGDYTLCVSVSVVNTKTSVTSIALDTKSFSVVLPHLALTAAAGSSGQYVLTDTYFTGISEKKTQNEVASLFKYAVTFNTNSLYVGTGTVISCGGETVKAILKGDNDGDGTITSNDHNRLKAYFKKAINDFSAEYVLASDVNGDGKISVSDYLKIRRHVTGSYVI